MYFFRTQIKKLVNKFMLLPCYAYDALRSIVISKELIRLYVFSQDNTTVHGARDTQEYLRQFFEDTYAKNYG